MSEPEHAFKTSTEFQEVYDLADPSAYFQALAPLNYRMPQVTCDVLRHLAPTLRDAFGAERLQVLDFGCGFGVNGALLTHRVSLEEIYAHFAQETSNLARDQAFFQPRRQADPGFEVGGLDIAEQALAYGRALGFLGTVFSDDATDGPIVPPLADYLAGTHVIIETGAVFEALMPAVDNLLGACDPARRPWVLASPRPDVDSRLLLQVFQRHGYTFQTCNRRPISYRKMLGATEREDAIRIIEARGDDSAALLKDGWFHVDLVLARPADTRAPSLDDLLAQLDEEL
ncbi:MAG: hypothetical protein AAF495_16870 [Pseudomonadota bacterium]